ncbi:unnamed protein product [Heterosigma akashiwo]
MFQAADGTIQELDDLQLPKGKKIMFQDSQGNLQELSAATNIRGSSGGPSAEPKGGKASSDSTLFLTSPLVVVGAMVVAVLGLAAMAQRRLHRSAAYDTIRSSGGYEPNTADFFDSEANYRDGLLLL